MSSGEFGLKYWAASPHTSGRQVHFEATTGVFVYMASSAGRPNPSYNVGKTKASA